MHYSLRHSPQDGATARVGVLDGRVERLEDSMYKKYFPVLILILLCAFSSREVFSQDGPPVDLGPMDVHEVVPNGTGQDVLVIYVQGNDHRVFAADLAGMNTAEDTKLTGAESWFEETSWGSLTIDFTTQLDTGGQWYTLPEGLLEYVHPNGVPAMQSRAPASATAANPTPPADVDATASADATSQFGATAVGDYFYAVSTFRNGTESQLRKLAAAVAIADGDVVELEIDRPAANDADRYLIYRTAKGATNADANFSRIGQIDIAGATDTYVDTGKELNSLANHHKLLEHAMEAAAGDVGDYEDYDGVIAIIFSPFLRGQASGAVTFEVDGTSFKIETINQSSSTSFGRFVHEMGHWIGLPDLYDPVTSGSFASWDTMDCACDGQYYTWLKDFRLEHIEAPGNVLELIRPAAGDSDTDEDYVIHPTELEENIANRYTALKIKSSDTVHYYIEGRDHIASQISDQNTPDQNIVITEAIDVLPMGIIPKRNVKLLTALDAGDPTFSPDSNVEITFESINGGTPESYNVNVKLKAQPQPDVKITPWSPPPWQTVDIWVDSEREGGGFQTPATAVVLAGNGEHAWINHVNRVWAKITNVGDGPAANVQVVFKVNTPGGMGASGQFVDLASPAPIDLDPGESKMVFAEWTPTVSSHTCIKVEIAPVSGESDPNNNFAQENVDDFYTGSNSPWHTVTIPIDVANPFDDPRRVDIEVGGLPPGWRAELDHKWIQLAGKEDRIVEARIIPPEGAPECTTAVLDVYGLMQIDDFIQVYGGMTPIIHLANEIRFRMDVTEVQLEGQENSLVYGYRITGCTIPPQANTQIAIELVGPGGTRFVHHVTTDAQGCFDTFVQLPLAGTWTAQAYFPGNECKAPTESDPIEFPGRTIISSLGRFNVFGVFTGGGWPSGDMADLYDPGFLFVAQGEWSFRRSLRLGLQLGYHDFDAENTVLTDNLGVTNVSFLLRGINPGPNFWPYFQVGIGAYLHDGDWDTGVQAGLGLELPVNQRISLATGATAHFVDLGSEIADLQWTDVYLGFLFRLP
jgi:hypothetical protein